MNKYQQALNNCVNRWAPSKDWNLLKGLVEKATPKTPIFEHSGQRSPDGKSVLMFFKYKCQCCERRVTDIDKFCPCCGQALDWGTGNNV